MKNSEKYKDLLTKDYMFEDIYCNEVRKLMLKEYNKECKNTPCMQCGDLFGLWLQEESKINWNDVKVDTLVLVSDDGFTWHLRHFAKCKDDNVIYAWENGKTSKQTIIMKRWNFAKLTNEE